MVNELLGPERTVGKLGKKKGPPQNARGEGVEKNQERTKKVISSRGGEVS